MDIIDQEIADKSHIRVVVQKPTATTTLTHPAETLAKSSTEKQVWVLLPTCICNVSRSVLIYRNMFREAYYLLLAMVDQYN